MSRTLHVEVVYALALHQELVALTMPAGATVAEALAASRLAQRFPEIDTTRTKLGIFGRLVTPRTVLREGDRVEIYRPLIADPKDRRRVRAANNKTAK